MTDRMMTDPDAVGRQYATEANLETRRSVWQPTADGRDPVEVAAATQIAALAARPGGRPWSTTTTHFSRADRVGSLVRISSGSKPTRVGVSIDMLCSSFVRV